VNVFEPMILYAEEKFAQFSSSMAVFQAGRMLNPVFVSNTKPSSHDMQNVFKHSEVRKFISPRERDAMVADWSRLLTLCEDYKGVDL